MALTLSRILKLIRRHQMLTPGARIGVAVSGGADSVCLLHVLHLLTPQFDLVLHVLHLNHGLRGQESDGDERFVAELAESLGLSCTVAARNIRSLDPNLEQAGRLARQEFFADAVQRLSLSKVATGHTLDDQAETVLYRAARGSGIAGLSGILPTTNEHLIRPLLETSRTEIVEWLGSHAIRWREDSSNQSKDFDRNRIRQQVLPALEEIRPGARQALARLAGLAREDEEYWREVVEGEFGKMARGSGWVECDVTQLTVHPAALKQRLLRRAIEHALGSTRGLTLDHIDAAVEVIRNRAGEGSVTLPGGEIRRSLDRLRIHAPQREATAPVEIRGEGYFALPGTEGGISLEIIEKTPLVPDTAGAKVSLYNECSSWLDSDRISFPLTLRAWIPGDAYQPLGRAREFRLKELFQLGHVPSWERSKWPMLLAGNQIVWSRQFGAAKEAAAGSESERLIRLVWSEDKRAGTSSCEM